MDAKQVELSLKSLAVNWVNPLALQHCPYIGKMKTPPKATFHREVTIRIATDEVTRFGKPKPQRRRFDLISLVKPHYKAWGEDLFSVGIEIKVSNSDLTRDSKYKDYLPYVDYFAFAVPTPLLPDARRKIGNNPRLGLINADTGHWAVIPELEITEPAKAAELYKQIAFSDN